MNPARTIIKNLFSLTFAEVISKGLGFFIMAYLARVLGPAGFGKLGFAQALITYFILLVNLGLDTYGAREVARGSKSSRFLIEHILTLRLIGSFLAFGLLWGLILLIPKDPETKQLLFYLGFMIFAFSLTLEWFFQGKEQMHFIALGRVLKQILYAGLIFFLVHSSDQVVLAGLLLVVSTLLPAFLLFGVAVRREGWPKFHFRPGIWKDILKQSLPIGISLIMITIYYNLDTVMLGFMKSDEMVGWYNAAYKIVMLLILPSALLHSTFLPALSRHENRPDLEKVTNQFLKIMFLLGIPIGFGGLFLSGPVILLVFGPEYQNSVVPLQILAWNVVLVFINVSYGVPLLAWGKQNKFTKYVTLGAVANLIFNFILIPPYGTIGAASATVLAELAVFFGVYAEFQKSLEIPFLKYFRIPTLASLFMAFVLFLSEETISNAFLLFGIGIFVYLGFLLLVGELKELKVQWSSE